MVNTTKKYSTIRQPSHYRLGLDCGHSPILTPQQLKELYVESRYEPTSTMLTAAAHEQQHTDVILCPDCRDMKPGHCDYTPLHRVIMATPLYSRQVSESKQPSSSSSSSSSEEQEQVQNHE